MAAEYIEKFSKIMGLGPILKVTGHTLTNFEKQRIMWCVY